MGGSEEWRWMVVSDEIMLIPLALGYFELYQKSVILNPHNIFAFLYRRQNNMYPSTSVITHTGTCWLHSEVHILLACWLEHSWI